MSAFVVDKEHIDAMVSAGVGDLHSPAYPGDGWFTMSWAKDPTIRPDLSPRVELRSNNASDIGRMLWEENFRSVLYRYPDCTRDDLPGPIPTPDPEAYTYTRQFRPRKRSAVDILKLIDSYEYQSCEHPEWHSSEARSFCDTLRRKMIHNLPGYSDSDWEAAS